MRHARVHFHICIRRADRKLNVFTLKFYQLDTPFMFQEHVIQQNKYYVWNGCTELDIYNTLGRSLMRTISHCLAGRRGLMTKLKKSGICYLVSAIKSDLTKNVCFEIRRSQFCFVGDKCQFYFCGVLMVHSTLTHNVAGGHQYLIYCFMKVTVTIRLSIYWLAMFSYCVCWENVLRICFEIISNWYSSIIIRLNSIDSIYVFFVIH